MLLTCEFPFNLFHSANQGTVSKQVLPLLGAQWRLGVATDQSQHSLRQQDMPATICAVHKLHHHVSSTALWK